MSVTLAVCSMACAAGNDLVFKQRAGAATPPARHLALVAMVWTACFAMPACATSWAMSDPGVVWGVIAGGLGVIANLLFLSALGHGEVGACATVFRLNLVPATLLAVVLLGEELTLRRALAVSAALGAVVALAGPRPGAGWGWLWLAIAACLARAGMGLAYKQGLIAGAGTERLLFVNGVMWLLGSLLWMAMTRGRGRAWQRSDIHWGLLSGLLICGNVLFLTMALARAPLTDVLPITQLGFIATMIIASIAFHEAITMRKLAALGLGSTCIILLGMP